MKPKSRHSKLRWGALSPIAFRYIPRQKLRNVFTILAIIIGVALIIGVNSTFASVMREFDKAAKKATGNVDIVITSLDETFNEDVLATVESTDSVLYSSARLTQTARLEGRDGIVTVVGIHSGTDFDFRDLTVLEPRNWSNRYLDLEMNSNQAAVSDDLGLSLNQDVKVNVIRDVIQIPVKAPAENYTLHVQGICSKGDSEGRDKTVYMDLSKAQEIYNCPGKVNAIIVEVTEASLTDQVVHDLNTGLGSNYIVTPVKKDLLEGIRQNTTGLSIGLQVTSVLALCISIVGLLTTMYMSIGERTHEIGILRSIGSSIGQVFWLFFSQSMLLGAFGATVGMVVGVFLTFFFKLLINYFQPNRMSTQELHIIFSSAQMPYLMLGAAAGLLTAIVGGVLPSLSACRVNPIDALRPTMRKGGESRTALKLMALGLPLTIFGVLQYFGVIPSGGTSWPGLVIALLAPAFGVIFLASSLLRFGSKVIERLLWPFKSTAKIISRNLDRNLWRSTACFTMIGLSLSFLIIVGGIQAGITKGMQDVVRSYASADLTVISNTGLSKSFSENITHLGNGTLINQVTPVFVVPQKTVLLNDKSDLKTSVTVLAVEPETYQKVMPMMFSEDTSINVYKELDASGGIVVTEPLAKSLNVSVGDVLSINRIASGPKWEDFTIVGITKGTLLRTPQVDGIQLSKTCYISYTSLKDIYPNYDDGATMFFAQANSSGEAEQAKEEVIQQYGTAYDLSVVTREKMLNSVKKSVDKVFLMLYTPLIFAALNAVIGVMSIMIINITMRKREIGILRSQGMSKSQVVMSLIGEVVILGIVGFIIATGLGLIFQSILIGFMNTKGFVAPFIISVGSIRLALVEAIFISVISAAYPSYRIVKLGIVESLRR
jgi:putative ABC transport system permease protein